MTAKSLKLTKPQQNLLDELHQKGSIHCSPDYRPALKLIELGLAEWRVGRFGAGTLLPKDSTPDNPE